jgi:hypothetical protein
MANKWRYTLKDGLGLTTGSLLAEDPRDAITRTLTSKIGQLFVRANDISPIALVNVPANAETQYTTLTDDGYEVVVTKE